MKRERKQIKNNYTIEKPQKNEWDLLLKLIPFLENNHKAIIHIISKNKSLSDYKIWAIIRFKRTNYLAEIKELDQILNILQNEYNKKINYSQKNKIYIRGVCEQLEIPEYHDDLPF